MIDNKKTTYFYFHPIIVPALLLLTSLMTLPILSLINDVSTFKGYFFIFIMAAITFVFEIKIIRNFILLIKGKPALTLTEKNLIDYQSGRIIEWADIQDISSGGQKANYISIKLYESEKYISKYKNPVLKSVYRLNSKLFHGTFTFTISMLKGSNENILQTLEDYLKTGKVQMNADKSTSH